MSAYVNGNCPVEPVKVATIFDILKPLSRMRGNVIGDFVRGAIQKEQSARVSGYLNEYYPVKVAPILHLEASLPLGANVIGDIFYVLFVIETWLGYSIQSSFQFAYSW